MDDFGAADPAAGAAKNSGMGAVFAVGACGSAARAADPDRERVEFGAECGDAFTKYGSI